MSEFYCISQVVQLPLFLQFKRQPMKQMSSVWDTGRLHLTTPFLHMIILGTCSSIQNSLDRKCASPSYLTCWLLEWLSPSLPVPAPSRRNKMRTEHFYLLSPYNFLLHIVYSFPRGNHCHFHFLIITVNQKQSHKAQLLHFGKQKSSKNTGFSSILMCQVL